jgi:hypothetical protein
MIISEVVLLVIGQVVSVIPSALVAQSILPPELKQEQHGAEDAEPDEAET